MLNRVNLCYRSANYNNKTGECVLSDMDRITLAGTNSFQQNEGNFYSPYQYFFSSTWVLMFR